MSSQISEWIDNIMIHSGIQNLSNIRHQLSLLGMHFLCLQKVCIETMLVIKLIYQTFIISDTCRTVNVISWRTMDVYMKPSWSYISFNINSHRNKINAESRDYTTLPYLSIRDVQIVGVNLSDYIQFLFKKWFELNKKKGLFLVKKWDI